MRALFALFIRSLRQDSRAKLPPILRSAFVFIILLIIWSNERSYSSYSAPGLRLLAQVMLLNLAFLAVTAVSIFPCAIAEEKEDETLLLLRMTNLNSFSILVGKGLPQLINGLLLLAVQIPFTLITIALGGVSLGQVLQAYALLAVTTCFLCGVALLASVLCRTIVRAGFLTGAITAFFYLGLPLVAVNLIRFRGMPGTLPTSFGELFAQQVLEANPIFNLEMLLNPYRGISSFNPACLWWSLGGALLCFLAAWRLFDRFCVQSAEVAASRPKPAPGSRKLRRRGRLSRAWSWSLVWKDFHFMVGGRRGMLRRILGCLLLFGVAYYYTLWNEWADYRRYQAFSKSPGWQPEYTYFWRQVSDRLLIYASFCFALDLLLITTRLFGIERRGLTLSSLVSLPWSTHRIFWQKILGCLPALLPWALLAFVGVCLNWKQIVPDLLHDLGNISWRRNSDEIAAILYASSQAAGLFLVTVLFSLRIRRGALPAALAVLAVWNILFALWMDSGHSRNDATAMLFVGYIVAAVVDLILYRAIHRQIEAAAAQD